VSSNVHINPDQQWNGNDNPGQLPPGLRRVLAESDKNVRESTPTNSETGLNQENQTYGDLPVF